MELISIEIEVMKVSGSSYNTSLELLNSGANKDLKRLIATRKSILDTRSFPTSPRMHDSKPGRRSYSLEREESRLKAVEGSSSHTKILGHSEGIFLFDVSMTLWPFSCHFDSLFYNFETYKHSCYFQGLIRHLDQTFPLYIHFFYLHLLRLRVVTNLICKNRFVDFGIITSVRAQKSSIDAWELRAVWKSFIHHQCLFLYHSLLFLESMYRIILLVIYFSMSS